MGCCNCKEEQFNFIKRYKLRKENDKENRTKGDNDNFNNTSFELQNENKPPRIKPTKKANFSDLDLIVKTREMSTTAGYLRSESLGKELIKNDADYEENHIEGKKTLISNIKTSCISNKPKLNRNEKLNSFLNQHETKKWSTNFLNSSKIIITEKDSKKEDSERTNNNNSARKVNFNNNINVEGVNNSNDGNTGVKNRKNVRLMHIASDYSLSLDKGGFKKNVLKTNKTPKLITKRKELERRDLNYTKISNETNNFSSCMNNSRDTFIKYRHLFGDVESPSKTLRVNSNSIHHKRSKDLYSEEADLSTIRNNMKNKYKIASTIFTFRRENESLRNMSKNSLILGIDEIMHVSDLKIKRFFSNDFFK